MNEADRNALKAMLAARKFDPYISHIRFPHYKNLAPDLKIDFDFPITALVGPNGTNKSSILRAIQGSPGNENLGVRPDAADPPDQFGGREHLAHGNGVKPDGAGTRRLKGRRQEPESFFQPVEIPRVAQTSIE